jgi:hypothetical protein
MSKKETNTFYAILGFLVIALFGFVMFHELKHGDFPAHIAFAKYFSENGYLYKIPHTLFARGVTIIRALLPANILVWISPYIKQIYDIKSYEISTLILMTLTYLASALIISKRFYNEWNPTQKKQLFLLGFLTFIVLIIAPIFLFTFPSRMFLGYVMGNRFDSPTYILSEPFVLLFFISLVDNFKGKWNWKAAFLSVIYILCATLAKPSFTITILPALGILVFLNIKNLKTINWFYLIGPVGLTSIIVLIGQFIINYSGNRGDRVLIAPFSEILTKVPNLFLVAIFILLSIAFPLAITILNWKEVKERFDFQLSWVNYFVAQAYGLIFAEEINFGLLNFWNSTMIGVFVLFFVCISFWGKDILNNIKNKRSLSKKQITVSVIFGLHIICGIIYLIATILNTGVNVN